MNTNEIVKHLQEVQEEYCELRANSRRSSVDNLQLSLGHLCELTTKRRLGELQAKMDGLQWVITLNK